MSWVGRILAWLVILGIGAIVTVAVLIPRIAGATPYVVLTGSMEPTLPPGTLVVAKSVKSGDVGIGDVVTYQLKPGEPTVVTHRVVAMGYFHGEPIFQTKGDANNVVDQKWVRQVQIRGVAWYAVPYLGYATSAITGQQRQTVLVVVVTLLLGYAAYMFTSAGRERRKQRTGEPAVKGDQP